MIQKREDINKCLFDVGLSQSIIDEFYIAYTTDNTKKQEEILNAYRSDLLSEIHENERKISCIDYLIYEIKYANSNK
ncbi:hypothetical protein [Terrisporobacter sp.]